MHSDLAPHEVQLTGRWVGVDGAVRQDATAARVEWLVAERLERLATDASGWDTLYRDPRDGRLWELIYPDSGQHGGGVPRLSLLDPVAAAAKYRVAAS